MWKFYKLLNTSFLEDLKTPDYSAEFDFGNFGVMEVRFFKSSDSYGVLLGGFIYWLGLNGRNPFIRGGKAVFIDENGEIWAGFYED